MSMQRINVIGLLASIVIALGPARSQDFNQRYAAWQGRTGEGVLGTPGPDDAARQRLEIAPNNSVEIYKFPADIYATPQALVQRAGLNVIDAQGWRQLELL